MEKDKIRHWLVLSVNVSALLTYRYVSALQNGGWKCRKSEGGQNHFFISQFFGQTPRQRLPAAFAPPFSHSPIPLHTCTSTSVLQRGGGVLIIMHGRSRMTIEPRIPAMPGRSTSGFTYQTDVACTKREAPSASRVKGELHPTKSRLRSTPAFVRNFLHKDGSIE